MMIRSLGLLGTGISPLKKLLDKSNWNSAGSEYSSMGIEPVRLLESNINNKSKSAVVMDVGMEP